MQHSNKYDNLKVCPNNFLILTKEFSNDPETQKFFGKCTICCKELFYDKYICCVCKNTVMCVECEESHIHPSIKFKNEKFSSISNILYYLMPAKENIPKKISNFIKKPKDIKVYLQVSTAVTSFTMRAKSSIKVVLGIENTSKKLRDKKKLKDKLLKNNSNKNAINSAKAPSNNMNEGDSDDENDIENEPAPDPKANKLNLEKLDIYIYSKSKSNVNIVSQKLPNLEFREQKDIEITIVAGAICNFYDITLKFYSTNKQVKIDYNEIKFEVFVNRDYEEEKLNCFFWKYPKLLVEEKTVKQNIKFILEQKLSNEHPYMILNTLRENNFDMEKIVLDMVKEQSKLTAEENKHNNPDKKEDDKCIDFIYENFNNDDNC